MVASLVNLKNAAQASTYYERDNYYSHGQGPSQWWGKAAEKLGLEGLVDRDTFDDLLHGKMPDGTELPGGHKGKRLPGYDMTFSAPKSVSLMAFIGDDDRIVEAHRKAVSTALGWLQETSSTARTTENDRTRTKVTGNLLVARFDHDTSRELDPQLHTHSVILNVTQREDGQWRAVANQKIYDNKMASGAIYRAELAGHLRGLGYEIDLTHSDGRFEIAGFSREQIEHFSQRRGQILEALDEKGFSSAKAAAVASLDTRKAKKDVDRSLLENQWKARASEVGLDLEIPRSPDLASAAQRSFDKALQIAKLSADHFSERASVFSMEDMVRFGMEKGTGSTNLRSFNLAMERMRESGELIDAGNGRVTTMRAVALEKEILASADRGKDRHRSVLERHELFQELEGSSLTSDQKEAIETITCSRDSVVGVQGFAGTGKTTMLAAFKELSEASGYEVRGFSNTASAANNLQQESGIKSETLASHLLGSYRPYLEDGQKPQIWVVDEASMMGTGQAARLLKFAQKANARVVLVGDKRQLPSIEAGKPFAMLMERGGMEVATMSTIIRQKDPTLKSAVELTIKGREKMALNKLNGSIHKVEGREDRLQAVADEYLSRSINMEKPPIVVTGTNQDRQDLNERIRFGLREKGVLTGEKVEAEVLVSKQLTKAERRNASSYQRGDVVRFGRRYKGFGVEKGEYAVVAGMNKETYSVTLEKNGGSTVEWEPWRRSKVEVFDKAGRNLQVGDDIRWTRNDRDLGRRNGEVAQVASVDSESLTAQVRTARGIQILDLERQQHWEHGYASTVHAAQGRTTDEVLIHLDTKQKNVVGHESWYVAISRARHSAQVFTDNPERLPDAIKKSMAQESALEALEKKWGVGERDAGQKDMARDWRRAVEDGRDFDDRLGKGQEVDHVRAGQQTNDIGSGVDRQDSRRAADGREVAQGPGRSPVERGDGLEAGRAIGDAPGQDRGRDRAASAEGAALPAAGTEGRDIGGQAGGRVLEARRAAGQEKAGLGRLEEIWVVDAGRGASRGDPGSGLPGEDLRPDRGEVDQVREERRAGLEAGRPGVSRNAGRDFHERHPAQDRGAAAPAAGRAAEGKEKEKAGTLEQRMQREASTLDKDFDFDKLVAQAREESRDLQLEQEMQKEASTLDKDFDFDKLVSEARDLAEGKDKAQDKDLDKYPGRVFVLER